MNKMNPLESSYLDFLYALVDSNLGIHTVSNLAPSIDGVIGIGKGSTEIFIYVKDDAVADAVKARLESDYEPAERQLIKIQVTGEIVLQDV